MRPRSYPARWPPGCRGAPRGSASPCYTAACSPWPAPSLLAFTYWLVDRRHRRRGGRPLQARQPAPNVDCAPFHPAAPGPEVTARPERSTRTRDLHTLVGPSAIALSWPRCRPSLGWLVAGRCCGPLRAMTAAARAISEDNLSRRLNVPGPGDELKDLGRHHRRPARTAPSRVQRPAPVRRQRLPRAAHPAHPDRARCCRWPSPTRTPPWPADRSVCEDVLEAGEHQEQLIEALLTLARSQRGLDRRDPSTWRPSPATPWTPGQQKPQRAAWPSPPPSTQRRPSPAMPGCWSGWHPT